MLVGVCKWLKCRNRRKKVVITAKKGVCDLGRFLSCFDFATLSGIYGDTNIQKEYFKKACELGKKSDENDK